MLFAILVTSVVANPPDVADGAARFLYAVQPLVPAAQAAASALPTPPHVALAPPHLREVETAPSGRQDIFASE